MNQFCAALIWVLLSVYSKTHFGVPENQYGLIPATNAIMVVLFQALVTRRTKKFPPLPVLAVGSFIYTLAVTSIAFGTGFWSFWTSMIVMTIGELMLMPTSSTYTANMAPADMRGRYMSIYGLTWAVAQGLGPLFGGILSDNISPRAPWFGGGVFGLVAVTAFVALSIQAVKASRSTAVLDAEAGPNNQ
jgi:MFS family permease